MGLKYAIFDLDGTLYEKNSVTDYALRKFSKEKSLDFDFVRSKALEAGKKVEKQNKIFRSHQEFFNEAYKIMLPLVGIESSKENVSNIENLIEEAKQKVLLDISPREGLIELLNFFKGNKIKSIVFSGGIPLYVNVDLNSRHKNYELDFEFKRKQIENLGLTDYFCEIIPTSKFGGYKPDKNVFLKLLDYLNCKGEDCIMIGDSENDTAAKQVGMRTFLLGSADCERFLPDYKVSDFYAVSEIIQNDILRPHKNL